MFPKPPNNTNQSGRRRKRVRPNASRNTSGANVQAGLLSVFPQRLSTSLPYVDELVLSTTASANTFGSEFTYRINSLFDPYFPAGGHQPYGFDQISPFYNHYVVHRCDIEVTFSDPSSDSVILGAYLKNFYDASTLQGSTISLAAERPTNWIRPLVNTGSQVAIFRKSVDIASMVGLTKTQFEGGWFAYSGLVTTDPAQTPYFSMAVADPRSAGTATTVTARVKLVFHAQFWGRKMPAQS